MNKFLKISLQGLLGTLIFISLPNQAATTNLQQWQTNHQDLKLCHAIISGDYGAPASLSASKISPQAIKKLGKKAEDNLRYSEVHFKDKAQQIKSLEDLNCWYIYSQQPVKREGLYLKTIQIQTKLYGVNAKAVLNSQKALADYYSSTNQFTKAQKLYQQLSTKGTPENQVDALFGLSVNEFQQHNAKAAINTLQNALKLSETKLGKTHAQTLKVLDQLAVFYTEQAQPDYKNAIQTYKKLITAQTQVLFKNHPDLMRSQIALVTVLYQSGDKTQANTLATTLINQSTDADSKQNLTKYFNDVFERSTTK